MLVVSTREFRENQKTYLDKIDEGTQVFIQRGKDKCYTVSTVKEDDILMSEKAFFARIGMGLMEIKDGKGREYSIEELKIKMGL